MSLNSFVSSSGINLINTYFLIHFGETAPSDIKQLCLLYCFILDEFDTKYSTNATIEGPAHCIASSLNDLESYISCRNILCSTGKYHWKFVISYDSFSKLSTNITKPFVSIGRWTNDTFVQFSSGRALSISGRFPNILNIYMDADKQSITVTYSRASTYTETQFRLDPNADDIRLCLRVSAMQSATVIVKMVEYHNSDYYLHHLLLDPTDAVSNIGYAQCIHDAAQRIHYYENALRSFPKVAIWNDAYLSCLIQLSLHNQAYQHAIQWKKGSASIAKLVEYFCNESNDEMSYNLCKLLSDEELQKHDLLFQCAYCCSLVGSKEDAIKYYQMYYEHHCDEEEMKLNIQICVGNMAQIYYFDFDDDRKALEMYLKLDAQEIKRRKFNAKIGSCYYKFKQYQQALQYLELHLEDNADDIWAMNQISCVYDDMNDYENGKKYLHNALQAAQDDEDKAKIYTNFGVNAYFQGNLQDAIKYTKDALSLDVPLKTTAIRRNNMGKYYYKMGEYEKSLKYLREAIEISPHFPDVNGNFGVILYYKQKWNESVTYLEKCLAKNDQVDDRELIVDCLYVYGEICFARAQFTETVDKCIEIINSDDFCNYKNKDSVYYLLSKAYKSLSKFAEALQYLLEISGDKPMYKEAIIEMKANIENTQKNYLP